MSRCEIGSAWAGEHFCLNLEHWHRRIPATTAPLLDDETVAATVRNLRALEAAYGCRVAIEAGPRYYTWGERWDDHGAMREVAEETGCPIIVDVSHHLCSMKNLGRDPRDGLTREVLERTIELHLTGLGRHSTPGYFYDSHATPVPDEAWRLFTWVLERCTSLKAVTLEHSEAVPAEAYQADVARVVGFRCGRE
ncbi:MAG: DUF692 family protein [Deltaproteobacteria bacterium]|nr:DUF692 family protein [Deltaproteobacteria bacterium]